MTGILIHELSPKRATKLYHSFIERLKYVSEFKQGKYQVVLSIYKVLTRVTNDP